MVIADFSGKFLNAESAKDKDIAEIIGEGTYTSKTYADKTIRSLDIPVKIGEKELIYSPGIEAGRKLTSAFGNDTVNWIGKKFQISLVKIKRFGQVKDVIEITPLKEVKP